MTAQRSRRKLTPPAKNLRMPQCLAANFNPHRKVRVFFCPLAKRRTTCDLSSMDAWTQLRKHWDDSAKTQRDWRTPDEKAYLSVMGVAYGKLRELGWNNIIYCPKDGSWFLAICAGSTGVFLCVYRGEWPTGGWWIADAGDEWPAHPILWKPMP